MQDPFLKSEVLFLMETALSQSVKTFLQSASIAFLLLALGGVFLYVLIRRIDVVFFFQWVDKILLARFPRQWRPLRRRLTQRSSLVFLGGSAVFIGAVYLFVKITDGWMEQETLYRIDQGAHNLLMKGPSKALLHVMRTATHLGDVVTMLVITGVVGIRLWIKRAYGAFVLMAVTMGGGQIVVYVLKWAFGRARPTGGLTDPLGSSFPSGHTFSATVLYGFLIVLAWRFLRKKSFRLVIISFLLFLIFLTGVSRVVISVHWVSDVLGGWAIGLAWLTFTLLVTQLTGKRVLSLR